MPAQLVGRGREIVFSVMLPGARHRDANGMFVFASGKAGKEPAQAACAPVRGQGEFGVPMGQPMVLAKKGRRQMLQATLGASPAPPINRPYSNVDAGIKAFVFALC